MLQKVIQCFEFEIVWDVPMPCKTFVAVSSESCLTRIGSVNMGRSSKGNAVQADSIVHHFQNSQHELKVFCVFSLDFHWSSLLCSRMKVSQSTHIIVDKRDYHS